MIHIRKEVKILAYLLSHSAVSRNENRGLCPGGGAAERTCNLHSHISYHFVALNKERKNSLVYSILCYGLHERQLMEGFGTVNSHNYR